MTKRDVERAEEVVVVVVGHALALLADPGAWPSDLVPGHVHLVSIQVLNVELKAAEGVDQGDGDVGEQIVSLSLELRVRICFDSQNEISRFSVHVRLSFGNELGLHAVSHAGLDLDFQEMLLIDESESKQISSAI